MAYNNIKGAISCSNGTAYTGWGSAASGSDVDHNGAFAVAYEVKE